MTLPSGVEGSPAILAELARSTSSLVGRSFAQINFQVHHVRDRPRYLTDAADISKMVQTVTASANGVGLVIGTWPGSLQTRMALRHRGRSPLQVLVQDQPDGRVFHGSAPPNPTFLYEAARGFEGLISVEVQPSRLLHHHAVAVQRVVAHIAAVAASRSSPLLSVQAPVQLPSQRYTRTVQDPDLHVLSWDRRDEWGWSSSIAVRFSIALVDASAEVRIALANDLADYCSARGFGLWLGDTRPGYRSGNWFRVVEHDTKEARGFLRSLAPGRGHRKVAGCLPVTLVGPARLGSSLDALTTLNATTDVGVVACAISTLDDLAFIHLQLSGVATVASGDGGFVAEGQPFEQAPADGLPAAVRASLRYLGAAEDVADAAAGRLGQADNRAVDYQAFCGPPLRTEATAHLRRRPLWISWQAEGNDLPVSPFLESLGDAMEASGLVVPDAADPFLNPNIEYLTCRTVGNSFTRAKGKISIPPDPARLPDADVEQAQTKLALRLEDAWRSVLADRSLGTSVDAAVAWREYWLRHARARR